MGVSLQPKAASEAAASAPAAAEVSGAPLNIHTEGLLGRTDKFKGLFLERPGAPKAATSLRAAQLEQQGQQLQKAIERGRTYNHVEKVEDAMRGLTKHIEKVKQQLSHPTLVSSERTLLEAELSKASRLLDYAEEFMRSKK